MSGLNQRFTKPPTVTGPEVRIFSPPHMEKEIWFKRKQYGWGWYPVTWQGWAVTLGYMVLALLFGFTIDENSPAKEHVFTFFLPITLLTVTLIRICYKKGEKPRWQWGPENKKD